MEERAKPYLAITITRTMGSGGSFVGRRLATRLGCRYLDREILLEAAKRLHVDPEALETYDERHLSFWERTQMAYAFNALQAPYSPPAVTFGDLELFDKQKEIIREAAARGPVVVVGRGGFSVLRGEPGLLSVFLHAPFERRVHRIMQLYGLASLEEAEEMVQRSDKDRGHFVKASAGVDWHDPRNFHLSIDTARLGTGAAIELIYQAAMEVARNLEHPPEENL
jgi:cytidylate kinase